MRMTPEQLEEFQKRAEGWRKKGQIRTHKIAGEMRGVDIDAIHRHPKYGNQKTEVEGVLFDSKKEAERYKELLLLERAGEIHELERQVRFELRVNKHPVCSYTADFTYRKRGFKALTVEDSKGVRTRDYIIKKKLMKAIHNIDVLET